jgi:plasmid stabilization system protein ParE
MKLVGAASSLAEFPYRGRTFNRRRKLRRLCVGNYLIVYQIKADEKTVEVLGFIHGARIKRRGRLPPPS